MTCPTHPDRPADHGPEHSRVCRECHLAAVVERTNQARSRGGKRGGRSKSPAKVAAARETIAKARESRWKHRRALLAAPPPEPSEVPDPDVEAALAIANRAATEWNDTRLVESGPGTPGGLMEQLERSGVVRRDP